jgi:hypothetical protein
MVDVLATHCGSANVFWMAYQTLAASMIVSFQGRVTLMVSHAMPCEETA